MMISVDFDDLDTFNCVYGVSEKRFGDLRIFVEGGLAFPDGIVLTENNVFSFVKGGKNKFGSVENLFPRHYIYDPSRQIEYVKWELCDGLLRTRTASGEWVQYTSKADSQYAMHEFVGGCWFVFEDVHFSKMTTAEYTEDRKKLTGNEVIQESGSRSYIDFFSKKYFLEGVLEVSPGPGWMSWEIHAKSFHIEIPDD